MATRKKQEFKCASNDINVTNSYTIHKRHFKINPSIVKMEVDGKRHALTALPPGKSPSTPRTEGRVGLLKSRYTDHAMLAALTPD